VAFFNSRFCIHVSSRLIAVSCGTLTETVAPASCDQVLRARPVAIEVAETPPCHASMTRAVPPIEIYGVAKVAADGTERFGAT